MKRLPANTFFQNFLPRKKKKIANDVRADIIQKWVQQLSCLGIRPPLGKRDVLRLKKLHEQKDFVGMVRFIKNDLGLAMRLRVCFVTKGGHQNCAAWIKVPDPMPLYGTKAFEKILVTMYIPQSYLRNAPFESLVDAIAHELSHVILAGTLHPLKDCEEAVDLAAMMLGYRNFFRIGYRYEEVAENSSGRSLFQKMADLLANEKIVHLVGYLNRNEVYFAADLLDEEYARHTKSRPT